MLFSGASDLLPQIVKPLVNSSNDFSPCAHLLDSPQLSFHLSLLLPTSLNSCWLTSPQFHLSIFFSAQSKWLSCKLSCSGQWKRLSFRSWFSTFDGVIILASCTIIQSYWTVDCYLWVQRSSTFGSQPDRVCLGFGQTCRLNMPGPQEWSFYAQKLSH